MFGSPEDIGLDPSFEINPSNGQPVAITCENRRFAASFTPQPGQKMPLHVAEAVAMRATLAGTGAFSEFIRHNPCTAFRDFETAARNGFATAWYRLGRDYEDFNDHQHATECFERDVKLNIESCLYVCLKKN
jgi:hypothetical protein